MGCLIGRTRGLLLVGQASFPIGIAVVLAGRKQPVWEERGKRRSDWSIYCRFGMGYIPESQKGDLRLLFRPISNRLSDPLLAGLQKTRYQLLARTTVVLTEEQHATALC
jgi:hypothetical protein